MKTLKIFFIAGNIILLSHLALAAPPAGQDSVVQIVAEAQGLARVAPSDLPFSGTFWLMDANGFTAPAPRPPLDTNTPVYRIADGQYLVDSTAGQLFGNSHQAYSPAAIAAAALDQAEAVTNLVGQVRGAARSRAQQFGMQQSQNATNFISGTNADFAGGLSLEITQVAAGVAALNLRGATNWVYAIWATTDLLAPWRVEAEVWPTDTNAEPFTVAVAGRDKLFLKAEDWTDVDSNGDGVPDWWLWYWFGNFDGAATNLDIYGDSFLSDYENGFDPNELAFWLTATNDRVNRRTVAVQVQLTGGQPSYYACFVDRTAGTNWLAFTGTNLPVTLGPTDGVYDVVVGLKGFSSEATATWHDYQFTLDRVAPQMVITNPALAGGTATVSKPYLQLQGYANKQLVSLAYDISNAAGIFTNQPCQVTDQCFDTNRFDFTTNYFQAYDVPLALRDNVISLRVTDLAGNTATTNFDVLLDYATATNPPVVRLTWPLDGMAVSGTNVTLRGTMSDETGGIVATVVNGDGTKNTLTGLVERNGDFWVENVPLNGISQISIQATDAAGNVTTTNFTVNRSLITLMIDSVPAGEALWQPTGTVSGQISDPTAIVFVNGIQGTNTGNGTWSARRVPIYGTGTAAFNVSAISANPPPSFGGGSQAATTNQTAYTIERPPRVIVSHYEFHQDVRQCYMTGESWEPNTLQRNYATVTYNATLAPDTNNNWVLDFLGTEEIYKKTVPYRPPVQISGSWTPAGATPERLPIPGIPEDDWVDYASHAKVVHSQLGTRFWRDQPADSNGRFQRLSAAMGARSALKLYTGGKAEVGAGKNLLRLQINAYTYEPKPAAASLFAPWYQAVIRPFTNFWDSDMNGLTPISPDGVVWKALPDNTSEIVTFHMRYHDNYYADVTPTKYKVNINLTTSTTNANLETDTPEVCVGQKVTFALTNLPMDQIVNMVGNWQLPQKFVNAKLQFASPHYYIYDWLLQNTDQTSCWFVNGTGGKVGVNMNLKFINGQYVSVAANGHIKVFRPQADIGTNSISIGPVKVEPTRKALPAAQITSGDVVFDGNIYSKDFSGQANWLQLVKRQMTCDGWGSLFYLNNNTGDFWLDNDLLYNTQGGTPGSPPENTPVRAGINTNVPFSDRPTIGILSASFVSPTDVFKSYLVFNPDSNNISNIWVTLGRVDWGWNGYAAFDVYSAKWVLITGSTNFPKYTDTDEFPVWPAVYRNSK